MPEFFCNGCQSRQCLRPGDIVGGPRDTWWCNDCYLAGRPRVAACDLLIPDFSNRGSSSPWNAVSDANRRRLFHREQSQTPGNSPSVTASAPAPTWGARQMLRICRVCGTLIPPNDISKVCLPHQFEPLCLTCRCPICTEDTRIQLRAREEVRRKQVYPGRWQPPRIEDKE